MINSTTAACAAIGGRSPTYGNSTPTHGTTMWTYDQATWLLFSLPVSAGALKFTGNDIRPAAGPRLFAGRGDSRHGRRRILFACRFRSNAHRRADKPQRHISNRRGEHHGCGNRRSASHAEDSGNLGWHVAAILHYYPCQSYRRPDHIIFRQRRPMF